MATDAVAEIKARVDIVDVAGSYVRLHRSGRGFMGLCPFHSERTPSFSVSQERQAWYCFGCQQGGDVISFVEKVEHLDFLQALGLLAERAGVELTRDQAPERRQAAQRRRRALDLHARAQAYYEHLLWSSEAGQPGRAVLAERGVGEETARRFGIGFAPAGGAGGDALLRYLVARHHGSAADCVHAGLAVGSERGGRPRDRFRHRLVFPIRDERGAVIGFGARALGDAVPKYLNSPATEVYDKSVALFGIDLAREAIAQARAAVVVEGYFDVIAAHTAGVGNVVASSGTALTGRQVRTLARFATTVVLCFDGDAAGEAAASKAVDVVAAEGMEARIVVLPAGVKDPDEAVRSDAAAFAACVAAAAPEWQVLLDRAVGDAEGGSVDERRHALERAVAVLARIPEASTRDLYVQQTARRFDLAAAAVGADVASARRDRAGPSRVTAAAPPPPVAADDGDAGGEPVPVPPWEAYIGRLVVQRPALAGVFAADCSLRSEELTSPVVAHVYLVGLEIGSAGQFPLHALTPQEQSVVSRLLFRPVPELDDPDAPERLLQAMTDCVRRLRVAAVENELGAVRREKRRATDEGRQDDVDRLAVRLQELAAERQRLRAAAALVGGEVGAGWQ